MTEANNSSCSSSWHTERVVRIFAGFMVLLTLLLGVPDSPLFVSKMWLWFTVFVGANLFQSGFTRLCPLDNILKRLFGLRRLG